ncbi:MAG TPA: peptide chain release factor-like protein [Verrucomicrobiales bacterium]|nr:peptide chain release factor-like protein [Verrucomicrobiales bacterium]
MSSSPDADPREESLRGRMAALGILESDLEETFVRSGGHGGQNVNKVSTCVMILHRPTGTQVKCQTTRHQALNRQLAREQLVAKIEAARRAVELARREEVERLRRQKRGRSRGAKERILRDKSHNAARKARRRGGRSGADD